MPPGVAKKKKKNLADDSKSSANRYHSYFHYYEDFLLPRETGVRVPGGPEEEEVPMEGQIRKWPDLPGSPVSLIYRWGSGG